MLTTVEGIITRTVKYGESSLILDLLTENDGLKSFIIGGVRKKGVKNKSAITRILNIVKVEAYVKSGSQLSRIKEINNDYIYSSIPFDVVKSSIATFIIEVCRKVAGKNDDSENIYNYIIKGLVHLDKLESGVANFHLLFLIGLTKHLGFEIRPNLDRENQFFDLKSGAFTSVRQDLRLELDEELSMALFAYIKGEGYERTPRKVRQELLMRLVDYYKYHIEDFGDLRSLDVLTTLFS